jgi:predicted transcriptional regulator of viral defense system
LVALKYVSEWVRLLSEGRTTVTVPELVAERGISTKAARQGVQGGVETGWLFSPARGIYVVVPPEYHSWGVLPGERFIDATMRHLGAGYYVGYLSAAAHHGASHQASQVYQVVVDRRGLRGRDIRGLRLHYYYSTRVEQSQATTVRGEFGKWQVSTPETTLLDLLEHPERGGGFGNVLTVAAELPINVVDLVSATEDRGASATRRAGWVLERTHPGMSLDRLAARARLGGRATPLDARADARGPLSQRWRVLENVTAEAEA